MLLLLLLPACKTHYPFEFSPDGIHNADASYGITVSDKKIISYTSIPGEIETDPSDYNLTSSWNNLSIFNYEDVARVSERFSCAEFLEICQSIQNAVSWTASNFSYKGDVAIELLLMPHGYGYSFASAYPFSEREAKVRFAFEVPLGPDRYLELEGDIVRTIVHELTHAYVAMEPDLSLDPVSSEVLAIISDLCAVSKFSRLPFRKFHQEVAFSEHMRGKIINSDFPEIYKNLNASTYIKADALVTRFFHELKKLPVAEVRQDALMKTCLQTVSEPPNFSELRINEFMLR